ncbi:MAG TPA: hypothetical protein VMT24_15790 [Aggregatilineaceae bacterium]|nr:hypothetical protein [Aggregatilineaceae bacterium]
MFTLFKETVRDSTLRSPQLAALQRRLRLVYDSRYTWWLLLALGVVRVVIFLLAYPPARGADSTDYFLYAAQFEGLKAPIVFELIYPLYPLLMYLTHYVMGSIYWLIGLQFIMSAVQGVMFYWAIRPYSPALAFGAALMVLADAQAGILYNFTSTEPPYMFLLNLSFCVFLIQLKRPSSRWLQVGDVALGVLLVLTLLTRPVGRYLIVPFGVLFIVGIRSWRRTAVVAASYGIALLASVLFNQAVFNRLELNGGGTFMLNRPVVVSGLLHADNGPASARLIKMRTACPVDSNRTRCLIEQTGSWPTVRKLYSDAYQEMLQTHGVEFARKVVNAFTKFLKMSGQQYSGPVTPSAAQCADVETTIDGTVATYLERDWLLLDAPDVTEERLRPIVSDYNHALCPPWPDNATVRRAVDWVALHYRSLSRPHPYVWYAGLGFIVLVIPWARRYLFPVLIAGAILANHAAVSAMVLNVQPRYTAVVNAFKGFLLLTLLFIIGLFLLRVVDALLARRAPSLQGQTPEHLP